MRGTKFLIVLGSLLGLAACSSNQAPVSSANNPDDQSIQRTVMNNVVYFPFNSSDVPASSAKLLTINASYLIAHPTARVQVQGNSSEVGTSLHNQQLALQRAQSVQNSLLKAGVPAKQLSVISYGNTKPVFPSNDKGMQPKNQRVDIVYTSTAPYQYKVDKVPSIDSATMY